jgi:NAD(P)-dependent dehydrogenase (short-subunit alcohol dehydrogenase family)
VEAANEDWQRIWDVNVMAHVYAARAVLPGMLARGQGYLLHTASAAGLLTNLGTAPYSVTKHAALGLAEWLAITHGDDGINVSCLCPQGVRTNMVAAATGGTAGDVVVAQGLIEPEDVAEAVVEGLRAERFLILPHPEVLDYFQRKAADYDRWLGGMRKLQARLRDA